LSRAARKPQTESVKKNMGSESFESTSKFFGLACVQLLRVGAPQYRWSIAESGSTALIGAKGELIDPALRLRPRLSLGAAMFTILALFTAAATLGLPSDIDSLLNDYNPSLDADEQVMVFARSEAEFRNARIYVAERRPEGWSAPQPIGFADPRYADSDEWLSPDGQTLYFITDRPAPGRAEGRRDYDIWRAQRSGAGWGAP
jgi:hypothetical protein